MIKSLSKGMRPQILRLKEFGISTIGHFRRLKFRAGPPKLAEGLKKIRIQKLYLDAAFLVFAMISVLAISHSVNQAEASARQAASVRNFNLKGTIRTSDQSPVLANTIIMQDSQSVYESKGCSDFQADLTGGHSYQLAISQDGYDPVIREYLLDKDLDIVVDLARTPVPPVAVPVAPAPIVTAPAPRPRTPTRPATRPTVTRPSSSTTAAPAAPTRTDLSIAGILDQINVARRANGLGAVTLNSQLNTAALAKAKHMSDNNYFAHTAPDGTTDWSFVDTAGYKYRSIGANLAKGGFGSGQQLVDGWMNSPGHKVNILASYGKVVGIGMYGQYFVMFIAS